MCKYLLEVHLKTAELSELGKRISQIKIPVSVTIELTERCCFKCIHCARDVKKTACRDITTEKWIQVIDDLAQAGTLELTFTGGEPLLHVGYDKLISHAAKMGFAVTLFSNAWFLDRKKLEFLKKNRLRQLQISLYSHLEEVHDRMTDAAGSYKRAVKAINDALELGIRVRAAVMLTRYNYKSVQDTAEWLDNKKIPFNYDFTLFKSENDHINIDDMRLPGHIISRLDRLMPKSRSAEKKIDSCNMGRTQACISATGEVFPCILFRKTAGNIMKAPFSTIWKSMDMDTFRGYKWRNMKHCSSCSGRNYCFICPGFNVTEGNLWNIPSSESCRVGLSRLGIY
jgi:radical SAM protein with 4Fe4S-binding SPASM domain